MILETNTSFPVAHVTDEGDPNDETDDKTLWILNETGSFWHYNGAIYLSSEDAALVEAGSLNPYSLINDIIYEMTESNE